jgi:hypothetical protein
MHNRKIVIESDGTPQPRNGVFVRVKAALEKFIQIHARGSRGESRSASFSSRSVSSAWLSNILAKPIFARD